VRISGRKILYSIGPFRRVKPHLFRYLKRDEGAAARQGGWLIELAVWKTIASGGHPEPVVPPPKLPEAIEAVTLWPGLRSFSAGCTAMTGVEAVSNGVSAFCEPVVRSAHLTLGVICAMLGILLGGIAYLVQAYGILAMDQTQEGYQSVLSQLAGAVIGRGWFYYFAMASVLTVLCLSANTSFVDFPRLCRMVAQDDYLHAPLRDAGSFSRSASSISPQQRGYCSPSLAASRTA
jgi:amino acid transporter